ncbi:MAG TPA: SUMF1/EgtB/PvdO family nonheme iron enzyme [Thermoanaerobaculia bacterium]|nr:SUMF1/EgtB/PvdO family nonheme iron enzyme [Thermoanaerobaculia bacterium]
MLSTAAGGALLSRFTAARKRTEDLFSFIRDEAFLARPIPLRHPIVFYRGHLPAFAVNTLLKRALGRPGIRADFETLFERGIDPADAATAEKVSIARWPERSEIEAYLREAGERLSAAFEAIDAGEVADVDFAREAAAMCIEHEEMHQETLLYIFHRLDFSMKCPPERSPHAPLGAGPAPETVRVPAGIATLGAERGGIPFGWDNEFPKLAVDVPAFEIDRNDVTNGEYLEFVDASGYGNARWWDHAARAWISGGKIAHPLFWERDGGRWKWRTMFEAVELPLAWPVYVSHAEASAFARWRGRRLPTEAEIHRAAYGTSSGEERSFPWGEDPPDSSRANFGMFRYDPVPVGSFPAGESFWGVRDLVGNGWEWTSTPFSGFPGFRASPLYPGYSADFFDGAHYVMKGGSPATAPSMLRRSFRNWFQPRYPYPYATFRCARDAV